MGSDSGIENAASSPDDDNQNHAQDNVVTNEGILIENPAEPIRVSPEIQEEKTGTEIMDQDEEITDKIIKKEDDKCSLRSDSEIENAEASPDDDNQNHAL